MKIFSVQRFPFWIIGALLYGISWPMPWNANLSFLAWFAFVFLFISLKRTNNFWRFWGTTWIFSFITHTICSGWFLDIPTNKLLIVIGAVNESLSFTLPFIPFYFLQKRAGFDKSIFILPFLFVAGEWLYCSLEHNLGYLLMAHSQTENLRLIQYADLFGFLSITFWVVLFNVLLYSAFIQSGSRVISISFLKKALPVTLLMVALPFVYGLYRKHQLGRQQSDSISVTMIHTQFAPNPKNNEQVIRNLNRIVEMTDSVSYYSRRKRHRSDLYVWHEGAIPQGDRKEILNFVQKAVNDWNVPLLSGIQYYEKTKGAEVLQPVNRVALFPVHPDTMDTLPFYDKVHLAPGWESIPYLTQFHKLGFRFKNEYKFHKRGDYVRLLQIPVRNRRIRIGTPICFEQNDPSIWNRMVLLGSECFIQVSFESWFGKTYFQKQVAYITRLRAIETRHAVARCSNGGLTFFVDAFGRIYSGTSASESVTSDSLFLSKTVTFYTRHPYLFPLMCTTISAAAFIIILVPRRVQSKRQRPQGHDNTHDNTAIKNSL